MSKTSDQKLKILYLIRYFSENTDEGHPVPMAEVIEYLGSMGISAERKSIYSDIEALKRLGYDIEFRKEHPSGYYLASRDFELAELKLLVDAVQSSKFITQKKSNALIGKIEKLASHYQGRALQRQVYVAKRVKTDNEAVLYNIDYIHEAISRSAKIEFKYCEWNLDKELVYRNNGKVYVTNPVALIWDDENYYLVACDDENSGYRHYRVDKMRQIAVSDLCRDNIGQVMDFEPAEYAKEHFGMFSGTDETVKMRFDNKLVGVIIDRFGRDVTIIRKNEEYSVARIRVQVSDLFFAWVAGFRGRFVIEGPDNVREQYIEFLDDIRGSL